MPILPTRDNYHFFGMISITSRRVLLFFALAAAMFFLPRLLSAQVLTGRWEGTLTQEGKSTVYHYEIAIPVTLQERHNFLILPAEDLGDISPNTVAVSVDDGIREQIIILSSNLRESGAVLIREVRVD